MGTRMTEDPPQLLRTEIQLPPPPHPLATTVCSQDDFSSVRTSGSQNQKAMSELINTPYLGSFLITLKSHPHNVKG